MTAVTVGTVFNIQRFSTEDGPGIRTTVFLKGCPLRCKACCNPEGLRSEPQLIFRSARCIGVEACGRCIGACAESAIAADAASKIKVDFSACNDCGHCVSACPARALETIGREMTVDEVLQVVESEGAFYRHSGGGITLSGGEVLLQSEFAAALLAQARRRGLSTAIETSGMGAWEALERLLPWLDVVHYDIKCMDSARHRRFTGAGNEVVLRNFRRLCEVFPHEAIFVRTPFVPGVNGTVDDVREIREFLAGISMRLNYELLPYHTFGEPKYGFLGLDVPMHGLEAPSASSIGQHRELVKLRARERANVRLDSGELCPVLDRVGAARG